MSAGRNTRKTTIKHPVFLSYAELETAPHWQKFFKDFAYGMGRKGLTYKDGALYYKKPRKKIQIVCNLPENTTDAVAAVKHFITSQIGEFSIDELTKKRAEMDLILEQNTQSHDISWDSIKAPTAKRQLLALYVFHLQENYDLSDEVATSLHTILADGIVLKIIKGDDILIKDHRIEYIGGVDYDDELGFYLTNVENIRTEEPVRKEPPRKKRQTNGSSTWAAKNSSYRKYVGGIA